MIEDLEMTEQPPGVDPELTKAIEFAILKTSELLSAFGIEIGELRVRCYDPERLMHTYAQFQQETGTVQ